MEEKMSKLTDSQMIVLSKASQRDDGAAVPPRKMNKAAAMKVGSSLVARKLMREIRSKAGMPIWREGEDGRQLSLVLTRAGRDAIGVVENGGAPAAVARAKASSATATAAPAEPIPWADNPRAGSKQARVVSMLSKTEGATLDALVATTGWLPHTTRAALTHLRKRGFSIERSRNADKRTFYRIVSDQNALAKV
jgi:hypothetical protein